MSSLHTVTVNESKYDNNILMLKIDSIYLSEPLIKTVQTSRLLREIEEGFQEVLYAGEDSSFSNPCSLCGRTSSVNKIINESEKDISKPLYLCSSCSNTIEEKLRVNLKKDYSEELLSIYI